MQDIRKRAVPLTLISLLALMLAGAATLPYLAPRAHAQTADSSQPLPRTITVVGEGTVNIKPDIARANIGVEVVKPTVQEASAENTAVLEAVLATLQAQGIDEADIQTSGFSVFAERFGPEGPLADDDVRYRVTNNVTVKIRDLDSVGTLLDAAIEAGANNVHGVDFALDDSQDAQSQARAESVDSARAKAEELATLTGVQIGDVISVSEVIGGSGFIPGYETRAFAGLGGGGGAPIAPGELEVRSQLQVVYAIAE